MDMDVLLDSDEILARRVQKGDSELFGVLMQRYQEKLKRYGSRFLTDRDDIEGIVQDVFVKAYRNIQSFDAKLRFSPWIYRIAHNTFANALRSRSVRPTLLPDFDELVSHVMASEKTDSEAEHADMVRMVGEGLSRLKPAHREILVLYYMEELSYKEISDVLRIPTATVGVRLSRAKQELKKVYEATNQTYE